MKGEDRIRLQRYRTALSASTSARKFFTFVGLGADGKITLPQKDQAIGS